MGSPMHARASSPEPGQTMVLSNVDSQCSCNRGDILLRPFFFLSPGVASASLPVCRPVICLSKLVGKSFLVPGPKYVHSWSFAIPSPGPSASFVACWCCAPHQLLCLFCGIGSVRTRDQLGNERLSTRQLTQSTLQSTLIQQKNSVLFLD